MKLTENTGRITGYSIIVMFLLGIFALMGLDSKIIVDGDPTATYNNIITFKLDFWIGIAGYLIILILDLVVSLGFYYIFEPANRKLSLFSAILRLTYTGIALVCVVALAFCYSEFYVNGLLIAYFFFILHLFILGITILKADYVPIFFGVLFVVAAPLYIVLIYGHLFLPAEMFNLMNYIVMGPAILAELLLGIWLIIRTRKIAGVTK